MSNLETIWEEILPESCPPTTAMEASGETFFRAVTILPPTDDEFKPIKKLKFPITTASKQCEAKAVSIFSKLESLKNVLNLKGDSRFAGVVQFKTPVGSGKLLRTGKSPDHYSWWRMKGCEPHKISCEVTE